MLLVVDILSLYATYHSVLHNLKDSRQNLNSRWKSLIAILNIMISSKVLTARLKAPVSTVLPTEVSLWNVESLWSLPAVFRFVEVLLITTMMTMAAEMVVEVAVVTMVTMTTPASPVRPPHRRVLERPVLSTSVVSSLGMGKDQEQGQEVEVVT